MKLSKQTITIIILSFIIFILIAVNSSVVSELNELKQSSSEEIANLEQTITNIKNPDVEASTTVAAKDAVYEEGLPEINDSYNYNSNTDLVLTCGSDLPNRRLMVNIISDDWTTIAKFQNSGDGLYDGTSVDNGQAITCMDGKQFRIGNASGTVKFSAKEVVGDLISEATDEEVQKVVRTYDDDGSYKYICYINDEEKNCNKLSEYDKLKKEVDVE